MLKIGNRRIKCTLSKLQTSPCFCFIINKVCRKPLTLRVLRGLNSVTQEKGFELCLACGEYSKKKKKVDIATSAVYSVI